MDEEEKKLLAKLNRLYKKYTKEPTEDTRKKIEVTCNELKVDYQMVIDLLSGDPFMTSLVQSMMTSQPVVDKIKEDTNGSKENNRS